MAFNKGFEAFSLAFFGAPSFLLPQNWKKIKSIKRDDIDWELEAKKLDKEANDARIKLDDYSFKIFLPCTKFATGWILDYEITKNGSYPTKWYIGTNAHVANHFKFVSNDYGQELPNAIPVAQGLVDTAKLWKPKLDTWDFCDENNEARYFDFNLSKQSSGKRLGSNYGGISKGQLKEPKLFYAPINFLKENQARGIKDWNYKDFAVIEIEFTNESYAKEITDDFYNKYKRGGKTPLNFFGSPWKKRKEDSYDYYSLGYAFRWNDDFSYSFSYDKDSGLTSQLAKNTWLADSEGELSATKIDSMYPLQMTGWHRRKLNRMGHFYLLENFPMAGGASGGLVIDGKGHVLGIRSMGDSKAGTDRTLVVPLWSNNVVSGNFKTQAYDLIVGGLPNQKTSYRQQVRKYILNKGRKTWLSKRAGWKPTLKRQHKFIKTKHRKE